MTTAPDSVAALQAQVEALTRQVKEAEARHRSLLDRLAELQGELGSSQQRHVILSERHRIAQDLHDRAAQTNFLMVLKLGWVLDHLPEDSPLRSELERLKELAGQAAAQTREAIYALRAPELAESGLAGGLRRVVQELQADGFEAELRVTGLPVPLGPEGENALFKVAQEAVNNARKHSGGSAVMIALRYTPAAVTLAVEDNGPGLTPEQADGPPRPGRFGLRGMRERMAAAGGELQLINGDDGGLIVRAVIPLAKG
jgi:signal transduction histidine kinase